MAHSIIDIPKTLLCKSLTGAELPRALAIIVCRAGRALCALEPQRLTQTIRFPHSSTESCTVARSQGLNGFTTHTGGAAGTPGGGQGGQERGGLCGLHGSDGLLPQGFCVNRGIRTTGSAGAQAPG